MSASSTLRFQIERTLEHRFPAALTPVPRTVRDVAPTGIREVDSLLDGGLPVGAISEITGVESTGRTTLALSFLARCTQDEQVCSWVDSKDTLDPESAAAGGVVLERLLWVRCRNSDGQAGSKPWARLDQALRATDLLLQAGGFATIVLDLGSVDHQHGSRIPLATWFRYRQAADRTRCCLVVLSKAAYAQSSAAVTLECSRLEKDVADKTVLDRFSFRVERRRERFAPFSPGSRKPPASTWSAGTSWECEVRA
jgi:hypothetical protein